MSPENTLLQPREEEGVKYERTFMASEFLDWLVQEGEATAREEAEQLCRRLLEHGIIQHGERAFPAPAAHALPSPGSLSQPAAAWAQPSSPSSWGPSSRFMPSHSGTQPKGASTLWHIVWVVVLFSLLEYIVLMDEAPSASRQADSCSVSKNFCLGEIKGHSFTSDWLQLLIWSSLDGKYVALTQLVAVEE